VLEFGLQTIHPAEQRLIERPTNLRKFTKTVQECIASEIPVEVSIIFGLPGQTLASFQQTVEFCMNLNIPTIHAFPLMLLRGTKMFDGKADLGLVESDEMASAAIDRVQTGIPHVIASNTFTHEDWRQMATIAEDLERSYNPRMSHSMAGAGTEV
jgi:radical SAM superfamily enzyme